MEPVADVVIRGTLNALDGVCAGEAYESLDCVLAGGCAFCVMILVSLLIAVARESILLFPSNSMIP